MTSPLAQITLKPSTSPDQSDDGLLLCPLSQLLNEHHDSLESLYERTPNPHPFLHPDSLRAQFEGMPDIDAIVLQHDGEIRCAAVLDPWSLNVGRIPRTRLQWRLHGRRVFAKGFLWDGCEDALSRWIHGVAELLREQRRAGLMLEAQAIDTKQWKAIDRSLSAGDSGLKLLRPQGLQPRWRIRLPSSVDQYWSSQFKGKTRNTLRRKRKKLGDYRIEVATRPQDVDGFLAAATEVSQHTWQSIELGLRVKNSDQEQQLFYSLAERCEFRGHVMWLDDSPVAFVINTSHDGYLHYEETGYLPQLAHLSPGTVLVSELIDDVINSGEYHTIDFGLGHADYKQLFSNEQTQSADTWLLRNSPVNAVAAGMISTQESMKDSAKAALQKSGVLRRLKKLKRHK